MLISAYKLKDPYSFIMAFFASNLMILISATLVLALFCEWLMSTGYPRITKVNENVRRDPCRLEKKINPSGKRLMKLRKDKKLTLKQLGNETGLKPKFISQVEKGEVMPRFR